MLKVCLVYHGISFLRMLIAVSKIRGVNKGQNPFFHDLKSMRNIKKSECELTSIITRILFVIILRRIFCPLKLCDDGDIFV